MRAVAVLMVFANHLFEWPAGGFVGVDVFFVLSGFFITGILLRERTKNRTLSFRGFYTRRVKRILPSALLVLVATVAGSYVLLPASRARGALLDALYAALFASNIRFQTVGADYFQRDRPPSPVLHYWSLSIEEQFYFIWPFFLVVIFALTHKVVRRTGGWTRQWSLFGAMALVVSASFSWALYLSATDPNSAYFSTLARVWELGIGALLAIAGPWLTRIPSGIRPALGYLGLTGVAASMFVIGPTSQFPAPWAALPVLCTALVVASFHGVQVRGMLPLTNPVAQYFGDTSYTLYLWHWPVIVLLLAVLPRGTLFEIVAVVSALVLTAVTYRFYEDPIRKSGWLLDSVPAEGRRTLSFSPAVWALLGGVTAAVVLVSIVGMQFDDKRTHAAKDRSPVAALAAPPPRETPLDAASSTIVPRAAPPPGADPCFGAPAMLDTQCPLRNPEVPLQPSIDAFANDEGGPTCWTNAGDALNSCTFGYEGEDATRIALVGDSHAARVLVALAPYLTDLKWQLTTYLGWGCAWQNPAGKQCVKAMPDIEKALLAKPYDLVVTTASREWGGAENYLSAWRPVTAAGSRIAVLADNPSVSEEALACLTRNTFDGDHTGDCGTPRAEALARVDPMIAAAARLRGAKVIDLTPYFCNDERCPVVIGNVIVYSDAGAHLTATYISTLAPALVDGLRSVLAS
ncbi:acyltransferase family protein [Mycobacterium sp. BMJ-28]